VMRGGAGADIVAGGAGDDTVRGGGGDDLLIDGRGSDLMDGGTGNDTGVWTDPRLTGGPDGASDRFEGGGGFDVLYLVTDEAGAVEIGADIAARSAGDIASGTWDLGSIGLLALATEDVVILDGGIGDLAPAAGLVATAEPGIYADAAAWGFV